MKDVKSMFPEAEIKNEELFIWVEKCLLVVPEYFWTLPASTSGKYHLEDNMEGGLVRHTRKSLVSAKELRYVFNFDDSEMDVIYSAIILHDTFRCGVDGQEKKKDGKLCSDRLHPLYPRNGLRKIDPSETIKKEVNLIFKIIEGHMGIWSPIFRLYPMSLKREPIDRSDMMIIFVHICDMVASRESIKVELK